VTTPDESVRVPSQERAIRTRASLVGAAKAEFSERGYASATAKSIAERAGVSTGSFYQYFRDKDQVLYELADERQTHVATQVLAVLGAERALPASRAELTENLRGEIRGLVGIVIEYHREDPGLHAVLTERRHADPGLDERTSRAETLLVMRIGLLLRALGMNGDVDATAFVLFGMVEGSVHAHVLGRPVVDDARLTDALVDAMVRVALS